MSNEAMKSELRDVVEGVDALTDPATYEANKDQIIQPYYRLVAEHGQSAVDRAIDDIRADA